MWLYYIAELSWEKGEPAGRLATDWIVLRPSGRVKWGMDKKNRPRGKERAGSKEPRRPLGIQERLLAAALRGSADAVERCVKEGADPAAACSLPEFRRHMSRSCLALVAAQSASLKCLRAVLASLPEDLRRIKLAPSLAVAAWLHGAEPIVAFLAECPAGWIDRERMGSALVWAMQKNNAGAVEAFFDWLGPNAVVDQKTLDTPLLAAARQGHARWVERFLPTSDALARDVEGNTALMLALAAGPQRGPQAAALLAEACDVGAVNKAGLNAFGVALAYPMPRFQSRLNALMERAAVLEASSPAGKSESLEPSDRAHRARSKAL